jgi:hypothetical protein
MVILLPSIHIKHSVASATYGFRVSVNTATDGGGSGTEYLIGGADNVILPSVAANWQVCSFPVALQFTAPTWTPGTHLFTYAVRNYTAGTLTFSQGSGFAVDGALVMSFGSFLL